MSYKDKLQVKLYKYENTSFKLQAIIDDYQEISFAHNLYEAGDFTITINYNIPNALKFERGMFIQFGNDSYMFGEILTINDSIGEDGKGSQLRTITGKDARYIFKRRIIKNLNNVENWAMTAKGELCLRNLINDQCGSGAETKRQLPITNTIPDSASALGNEYSVAESFSNLYDTLVTIATQSEIGWRIKFDGSLTLEVYQGTDLSDEVQFSTDFDSLSNGEFSDSAESFANTIYVGGKGTGNDRDIYEGESAISGESPAGLERYEAFDNQTSMTTESEYEAEALSMLTQYGQTITVAGQGLAKCPYEFKKEYNIGDTITLSFSGKSAKVQILSVTEHWVWGQYGIEFSFGKPQNDLSRQLQLILKQIQKASNKTKTTESVKYYTIPTDTAMPSADVVYDRIGFTGACAQNGSTFRLYLDDEKTGAKTYHVYFKQLTGGQLILTTGKEGATDLVLNSGTYVSIIYVDAEGNISCAGSTAVTTVTPSSTQPVTSGAVAEVLNKVNYSATARNIDTLYPSENGKSEVFGGNFSGNVPETKATAILKTFRVSAINSSEVQIYQEFEAYGSSKSSYAPNQYFRFGYFTGSASPTWTNWQKVIRNTDVVNTVENNNMNPITSNAVYRESLKLSYFSGVEFTKPDNYGRPSYLLIADCTAWWGASSGAIPKGMTGIIVSGIRTGFIPTHDMFEIAFGISYGRNSGSIDNVCTKLVSSLRNTNLITPVFLKNGNTYYMALKIIGSSTSYFFWGIRQSVNTFTQFINTTDSSGTLPSGWEIVIP